MRQLVIATTMLGLLLGTRVASAEEAAAQPVSAPDAAGTVTPAPATTPTAEPVAAPASGPGLMRIGLAGVGAGLIIAAVGVGFGFRAHSRYDDIDTVRGTDQRTTASVVRAANDDVDRANVLVLTGLLVGLVGGSLIVTDLVLSTSVDARVAVSPTPGGAAASLSLSF